MTINQTLAIILAIIALDWLLLWLWHHHKQLLVIFSRLFLKKVLIQFLSGVLLMLVALVILSVEIPLLKNNTIAPLWGWINDRIHLDVQLSGNLLLSLPFLAVGIILFSRAIKSYVLIEPRSDSAISPKVETKTCPIFDRSVVFPLVLAILFFIFLIARMSTLQNSLIDPILWILTISLSGFAVARYEKITNSRRSEWKIEKSDFAVCMLLMGVGLLVSSFRLADHPNVLIIDQGEYFEIAKSIALGNYQPSFFNLGASTFPIAGSYWQAFFLLLFGVGLWSWRFSSVVIIVLAVIPLYFLCLELSGKRLAILASICFLFSPFFLAFAGLGYYNSHVLLPLTASVLFLFKGYKKRSPFFLFLGGSSAGLGFMTYTAGRLSFVLGLVILGLWIISSLFSPTKRLDTRARTFFLLIFIFGWIITAGPHLVFGASLNQEALNFKTYESVFFNVSTARPFFPDNEIFSVYPPIDVPPHVLFFNPKIYLWLFQRGFLRTILSFFSTGMITDHFLTSPLPGPIATLFFSLGLVIGFKRIRDHRLFLILFWFFLSAILLSSLNSEPPRQAHLVPIIPPMAIFIAIGLDCLVQVFFNLCRIIKPHLIRKAALYFFTSLIIIAGFTQYFIIIPRLYKPNVDDVMNFSELTNQKNIPFFYITHREDRQKDWKPFFVREMVPGRPFQSIAEDGFLSGKISMKNQPEMVFVFDNEKYDEITTKLKANFGIEASPYPIKDVKGIRIGGMLIKGEFVYPIKKTIWQDIFEVFVFPSGWIASTCILIGFVLSIFPPRKTLL
jgi:4-amino-4-deoxy-L-arabinose transferase-like glycosyltransferase